MDGVCGIAGRRPARAGPIAGDPDVKERDDTPGATFAYRPRKLPWRLFLVVAIVVFSGCQAARVVLNQLFTLPRQLFSLPGIELNLVYAENRGVNFGLFSAEGGASQWILAAVATLVCLGIATVFLRRRRHAHALAAGMVVGGGLSNAFERIHLGYVVDYINTPLFGLANPFSYNIADIVIVLPLAWFVLRAE